MIRAAYTRAVSKSTAWMACRTFNYVSIPARPDGPIGFVREGDWRKDHKDHEWAWIAERITYDGVPQLQEPDIPAPPGYVWGTWIDYRGATCCGWQRSWSL